MKGSPHITLSDVTVSRPGRTLLRGLTFAIPRGSFVAVVGPSGAGKSSLLACLAGLIPQESGGITYRCLQDCSHSPRNFQKRLGLVFQHLRLSRNTSVLTNVLCGILGQRPWWKTLTGFGRQDKRHASELLDALDLGGYEQRPLAELSGGECQRVALARALLRSPEIVLADEPVSHLDARLSRKILGLLKKGTHENSRTVFCVLHDLDLVNEFADFTLSLAKDSPSEWSLQSKVA